MSLNQKENCAEKAEELSPRDRQRLAESNLGLVYFVAKKYNNWGIPFEDLVQEGSVGLVKAANKFDPDRGYKFATYATWRIRGSILDALRKQRPALSLQELEESGKQFVDENESQETMTHRSDVRQKVISIVNCLPQKDCELLSHHYGLNGKCSKTFSEIGDGMNLSKSWVSRCHQKAVKKFCMIISDNPDLMDLAA